MKNKKILFFSILVFFSGMFIFSTDKASAIDCGDGGTCKTSTDRATLACDPSTEESITFNDKSCDIMPTNPASYYICCKKKVAASNPNAIVFTSPLSYTTVEGLLTAVLNTFRGIVILLSMIFFIYGAIIYITSAGGDRIKTGKEAMSASLIGLALGIAAPSILKTIAEVLDWKNTSAELADAPSVSAIGLNILEFLLGVVGVLGMIMIIVGGIMYFGAGANEKAVETAKGIVKYAVIGLALALAAMVIVKQIAALLT